MVEKTLTRIDDADIALAAIEEIGYICTLFECSQHITSSEISHQPEFYLQLVLNVLESARLIG